MTTPPQRHWGIRSLATGNVYPFASTQAEALVIRDGTGSPERYEVVCFQAGRWSTPASPEAAAGPAAPVLSSGLT